MKYIFGIDISKDRQNSRMDGYIFQRNSQTVADREMVQNSIDITTILAEKISLPLWMECIKDFSFALACALLCIIIKVLFDSNPVRMNTRILACISGTAILFAVSFFLYFIEFRRKYKNVRSCKQDIACVRNTLEQRGTLPNIPEEAEIINVLKFYYIKTNNGRTKIVRRRPDSCQKRQLYAYIKEDNLYLNDLVDEWELPLAGFKAVEKMNGKICALCFDWYGTEYRLLMLQKDMDKVSRLKCRKQGQAPLRGAGSVKKGTRQGDRTLTAHQTA